MQARVWRAIHVSEQKSVAVTVFTIPFGGTIESRAELVDEWEHLKRLDHSAIAKCYGGGFEEADAYLAHELVEGPTLADQIADRGRLPWEQVLDLSEPLIDALAYLHDRGLVHGRLTPEKVIIAGLSPVLVDVRYENGDAPFRSGPYHRSGPPTDYELSRRPPEAPGPHDSVNVQSDLYQFGCVLYEALTGSPPITGSSTQELSSNLRFQSPVSVASAVLEVPVWMDKLVMQLLQKEPTRRPPTAAAVKLQLAEVRRRAMSRSGVAEHASAGFSPLTVADEGERNEARSLLGKALLEEEASEASDHTPWHDQAWVLLPVLGLLVGVLVWFAWPLNEAALRERAEGLLAEETRSALSQARISYLEPMLRRFPDGAHATWASEQVDRVRMIEAEHALTVKLNRNLPLKNEAERLCAEAMRYETFGDNATAVDKYQSMITLLGEQEEYGPLVNLARNKVARIGFADDREPSEASRILAERLDEADHLFADGRTIAARKIWYSIVDLYGANAAVEPLVRTAQDRLAETSAAATLDRRASP